MADDKPLEDWTVDDHLRHRRAKGPRGVEQPPPSDDEQANENLVRDAPSMVSADTWLARRQERR
jgi:hypothetical protein